jgi:hypothetical protein
LFLIKLF